MSAWGNKTSTAKSWDDDDEEKLPDFPGLGDSFGPPPTSSTTSSSSQFPSLGEAQNTSKKKKGTKLSLAEFSGITSSVSAPITDDNVYRPSRGGSGGGSDHVDVYALPKAPNRERREEEESERRRPGELGGAFKDYGGDRGGGGGGGYGGGRDRDEDGGTIGIGEMSHLAAEGETTIAISTKTGESEGASRNRVARIPEIGRRERCCRKEKKDVVVLETAAMGIGDTRIEGKIDEEEANRANRWDRVARIPETGRNERASERTIDTNPFASVRD